MIELSYDLLSRLLIHHHYIFLLLDQGLVIHQMQIILQLCEHNLQPLHHENQILLQAIHQDAITKKLLKSIQLILE